MGGPSLVAVLGRKAGSATAFPYSTAMKAFGRKWDAPTLDAFLTSPGKVIPRSNMAFAGQSDAAKRADIIAYLATLH